MKVSFEIPGRGDLHEVKNNGYVAYRYNDGGTTLLITTVEQLKEEGCTVTKFHDAKITIIIETDDQKIEYEGIEV